MEVRTGGNDVTAKYGDELHDFLEPMRQVHHAAAVRQAVASSRHAGHPLSAPMPIPEEGIRLAELA